MNLIRLLIVLLVLYLFSAYNACSQSNKTVSENGTVKYKWTIDEQSAIELGITGDKVNSDFNLNFQTTGKAQASRWFINIAASENEYFTGIFERVVDGRQQNSWADGIETAMDLRGEKVEMHLKPTVSAYAPFYISSSNYGFFVKGTWPGVFDFCKADQNAVQISFEGPEFAFKIYTGSTPLQVVQKHALETGPSIIPPEWALGPWRWRDNHVNRKEYYDGTKVNAPFNSELVEDILMMKAYDIPLTAYWIDRPWGPGVRGFDDYDFDLKRFPEAQKMIEWLNGKDLELMMWIGPFVMGKMADYAEEKGYFLKSNRWKNSRQVLMDFTNKEAVTWWSENGPGKLARMGIKGLKMDRADGEKLMDSLSLKTSIGTTYRENYNDYPRQYVKAAYEGMKSVLGDDFLLYPRAQYTGSAKYGGLWAGDTNGKPEGLRSAIIALQRCSVMGYPIWGSDIGGYWGSFSNETCMRWLGFGCFSPLMEVGPTNDQGFWNNPT
ncbi:MAG: glycoside hydrolase family 31 protein, partial [Calditrichaceae bacterium]